MKRQRPDERTIPIPPGQVDAAVALLSQERHEGRSFLKSAALELAEDLCVAGILFGLVVGAIVVWSELWIGIGLMLGALVCLILLGALPRSEVSETSTILRRAVEESHVLGPSLGEWRGRRASLVFGAVLMALGPLSALVGIVWLIWSQITTGTISGLAIVLVAAPTFVYWIWFAYDNLSELRYFKSVSRLLDDIREARSDDRSAVSVSAFELDILSQAESHRVKRTVEATVGQLPDLLTESYAVSLAEEPAQYLEKLAVERPEDWIRIAETLHALQTDPRPDSAHPASDVTAAVEVVAGRHELEYRVDDDGHHIYVLAIENEPAAEEQG